MGRNRPTDTIELDWCLDHDCWYVRECPTCMVNDVLKEADDVARHLKDKIADLEDEIETLREAHNVTKS